jgi:hypothetical protein
VLSLLVNAIGAALLGQTWLRPGAWRWLLLNIAALNPCLRVNIYVRGEGLKPWLRLCCGGWPSSFWGWSAATSGATLSRAALAGVILKARDCITGHGADMESTSRTLLRRNR